MIGSLLPGSGTTGVAWVQPALVELVAGFPGVSNKLDPRTRFIPGSVEPFPPFQLPAGQLALGRRMRCLTRIWASFCSNVRDLKEIPLGFLGQAPRQSLKVGGVAFWSVQDGRRLGTDVAGNKWPTTRTHLTMVKGRMCTSIYEPLV